MGKIQPKQIDFKNFPILGGGAYVIRDILWENPEEALQKKGDVINLTKPYDYYDFILLEKAGNGYDSIMVSLNEFGYGYRNFTFSTGTSSTFLICFTPQNPQKLIVSDLVPSGASTLIRITGIKFVNPNIYSTEEQRIGTWVDGRALYQKTITYNLANGSGRKDLVASNLANVDFVVEVSGFSDYGTIVNMPAQEGMAFCISVWFDTEGKNLMLRHTNMGGDTVHITYKYVKTE